MFTQRSFDGCAPPGPHARSHGACCPPSCGRCGGTGCAARPGGRAACCTNDVIAANRSCHVSTGKLPPCALDPCPWSAPRERWPVVTDGFSPRSTESHILLGILNANAQRQRVWRCALRAHGPWAGRPLFVVGRGRAGTDAHDLLRVDVEEGRCGGRSSASGRGGVCSQSVTGIVKLAALLRYAARQPERWVARCDDDTFVSLPALELHAARLPAAQRVVAGNFEWYNHPEPLQVGGLGLRPAQRDAQRARLQLLG